MVTGRGVVSVKRVWTWLVGRLAASRYPKTGEIRNVNKYEARIARFLLGGAELGMVEELYKSTAWGLLAGGSIVAGTSFLVTGYAMRAVQLAATTLNLADADTTVDVASFVDTSTDMLAHIVQHMEAAGQDTVDEMARKTAATMSGVSAMQNPTVDAP